MVALATVFIIVAGDIGKSFPCIFDENIDFPKGGWVCERG
jgi:hypothetical protein